VRERERERERENLATRRRLARPRSRSMPYWPLYLPLHCPLFHYFRRIPLRLFRRGARNLPLYLRTVIIDVLTEFNKRHKWPRDLICFTSLPGQPVSFTEQRRRYLAATSKPKSSLLRPPAPTAHAGDPRERLSGELFHDASFGRNRKIPKESSPSTI